jgi:hypothetical protein
MRSIGPDTVLAVFFTIVYAKHLPPSAGLPRVLALDGEAEEELAGQAELVRVTREGGEPPEGVFDAVAGRADPERLSPLAQRLRPGGRLILTADGQPEALLEALVEAGLIHCLVEPEGGLQLYRGERPPQGDSVARTQALAAEPTPNDHLPIANSQLPLTNYSSSPYLFLLITQTPNRPAWRPATGEIVTWQAATVRGSPGEPPALVAFSSLVKAVACMQGAVKAGRLIDVNKIGKFPAGAAQGWGLRLLLNPVFEAIRDLAPGPPFEVDVHSAITGDES